MLRDKKIYMIAKIFNLQGCIAYLCKTINEAKFLPKRLETIRAEGFQIVVLNNPELYSEYAPYSYVENLNELIESVCQLNRER